MHFSSNRQRRPTYYVCYTKYNDELKVYNLIWILEQHDEQHLKEKEDMMVQTDTLRQHNQVQMKT